MAENESLKLNHLILASLTAKTLKTGLWMLDIKAVKIMPLILLSIVNFHYQLLNINLLGYTNR